MRSFAQLFEIQELRRGGWASFTPDAIYYADKLGRWPLGDITTAGGASGKRNAFSGRRFADFAVPEPPFFDAFITYLRVIVSDAPGDFEIGSGWYWDPAGAWQPHEKRELLSTISFLCAIVN